ncbi:MAG: hypothetical protein ACKV2U_22330 [Bryobacteraceae bacterium]
MTANRKTAVALPPSLVLAELDSIVSSVVFARCPRMQRFLSFVVEETLAGRADELGEYGIGLAVFDRDHNFQPQLDPIVRNDARRLRMKLLEYYRHPHSHDVIIEIPKGGYVPMFLPGREVPSREPAVSGPARVAVLPIEVHSMSAGCSAFAEALGLSLTAGLANIEGLEVVAHGYVQQNNMRDAAHDLRLTHVIQGTLLTAGDIHRAMIRLIQVSEITQLWAAEYEVDVSDLLGAEFGIVACTIREVSSRLQDIPATGGRLTLVA